MKFFRGFGVSLMTISFILVGGELPLSTPIAHMIVIYFTIIAVGLTGFLMFKLGGGHISKQDEIPWYAFHSRPRRNYWQ